MRLATTIGEFYPYVGTPAAAVRQYEGTGFRCLDYSFWDDNEPGAPMQGDDWRKIVEAAGEEAARLGFTFVQAHSPNYNPMDPRTDHERGMLTTRRAIEACAMLGIPNIVVHPGCAADCRYPQGREEYFRVNKAFYESLFPVMEKTGVNVLIENSAHVNMGGNYFFYDGEDMKNFLAFAGHPLLHACWDTGHANIEGHQREDILALGDDLRAVHINDNRGERDEHVLPFVGAASFDEVLCALIEIGFSGPFTLECNNTLVLPHGWPFGRGEYAESKKLLTPPVFAYDALEKLLFDLGKYMLTSYGVYDA